MWDQVKQALDQSTTKFLTGLAHQLPGMVALIVALLISFALAWVLAIVVRRLLASIRFDERLNRWGFASIQEWSPMNSPTRLVSRTTACVVILAGFLIGIAAFDAESTSLLVRSVFAYIPNIVGAMLVLLVGSIIASFLARSVLIGAVNLNLQYARLLSLGVKWLVTRPWRWRWLWSILQKLLQALWILPSGFSLGEFGAYLGAAGSCS